MKRRLIPYAGAEPRRGLADKPARLEVRNEPARLDPMAGARLLENFIAAELFRVNQQITTLKRNHEKLLEKLKALSG